MPQPGGPQFPDFPNLKSGQKQTLTWDFTRRLPAGASLTGSTGAGTLSVNVSVVSGVDASPQSRITIQPAVLTYPFKGKNCAISLQFLGLAGVTYLFDILCADSVGDITGGFNRITCVAPA